MATSLLPAHSIAEVQLYIMATPCSACGQGPLSAAAPRRGFADGMPIVDIEARCQACQHRHAFVFDLSACADTDDDAADAPSEKARINASEEPSRILDVGQWLVLFRLIVEGASKQSDRVEARRLGYEAAQCLEEALKFYNDDDEPPAGALFHATTRARFERDPEQFSRRRLLDMRAKLPTLGRMRRQIDQPEPVKEKKWWQFWK